MSQYVDNLIKSHKVAVFSKTYCPYCVKAKNVLSKYKLNDLKVIELDDRDDSDQIQEYLKKLTGARTVPRVFIAGQCIGGGDDTVKLENENKLKPLLEKAGALNN